MIVERTIPIQLACITTVLVVISFHLACPRAPQMVMVEPKDNEFLKATAERRDQVLSHLTSRPLKLSELAEVGDYGSNLNLDAGVKYNPNNKMMELQNALILQRSMQTAAASQPQGLVEVDEERKKWLEEHHGELFDLYSAMGERRMSDEELLKAAKYGKWLNRTGDETTQYMRQEKNFELNNQMLWQWLLRTIK